MTVGLFFVALYSVAFATPHVGDFRQGDVFDEETLRAMTEATAERVMEMSERTEKAIGEYKKMTDDHVNGLLNKCSEIKAQLWKTKTETVSKAMEKKKPLDTFVCITTRAQESYRKVNATEDQIQNEIRNTVRKVADPVKDFKLSLKHLNDYVNDLYIEKSVELNNAADDAAKKKILNYVKQKMAAVETLLKNLEGRLATTRRNLSNELWRHMFATQYFLNKIRNEEVAKIKQCVS